MYCLIHDYNYNFGSVGTIDVVFKFLEITMGMAIQKNKEQYCTVKFHKKHYSVNLGYYMHTSIG